MRAFFAPRLPGRLYHDFMDAGFRRSGQVIYQPTCVGCRACQPIRIPVDHFTPSKSQRRCWRRNQDLAVNAGPPELTDEKWALYQRYLIGRHDRSMEDDRESLEQFLYHSPVDSLEFTYRDAAGRLLAVGLCDVCTLSLSSVYFFFDPGESRRGLGTFGVLVEIDYAARHGIPFYYLGYWVSGCASMQYKADFRPSEVLHPDGAWRQHAGPR